NAGLVSPVRPEPEPEPEPEPDPAVVNPSAPARYWDTRNEPTLDTQFSNTGRVQAGATYTVQVSGRGDVPAGAKAVVANLVAIDPGTAGYATMFPCTVTPPVASHLNFVAHDVIANSAIVPLSATGELCVFTTSAADFALDIAGYVGADSPLATIAPARYLDTRTAGGSNTVDGLAQGDGRVAAGTVRQLQIGGRGDVPADAQAAIVNITAVSPSAAGFLTVFDCGTRPLASTVNYLTGQVVPNGAVATLSATGALCIYSLAATDLVVDVSGYVPADAVGIETMTPSRLLDTRQGEPTVDAAFAGEGRVGAGQFIEVDIAGRADVPADATAAIVNVTVVNPAGPGYVTVYPCGTLPLASNINYQSAGQVQAGNSIAKLSATGTLCLYTLAETDLVLDVTGWIK
ncbi:MAG TPA: hypothetical protein PLV68_05560, partial [Ilumatobacteraceae bacterium]|nr:hypothetical protein [Ilumatobacteraceae bacterium]